MAAPVKCVAHSITATNVFEHPFISRLVARVWLLIQALISANKCFVNVSTGWMLSCSRIPTATILEELTMCEPTTSCKI